MHGRKTWLRTGQTGLYSEAKACTYVYHSYCTYVYLTDYIVMGRNNCCPSLGCIYSFMSPPLFVYCSKAIAKPSYLSCCYIGNFLQCRCIAIIYCCCLDIAWILTCDSIIAIGDLRGGIFTLHINRGTYAKDQFKVSYA